MVQVIHMITVSAATWQIQPGQMELYLLYSHPQIIAPKKSPREPTSTSCRDPKFHIITMWCNVKKNAEQAIARCTPTSALNLLNTNQRHTYSSISELPRDIAVAKSKNTHGEVIPSSSIFALAFSSMSESPANQYVPRIIALTGTDHKTPARKPPLQDGDQLNRPLSIYKSQNTGRTTSQIFANSQIAFPTSGILNEHNTPIVGAGNNKTNAIKFFDFKLTFSN